MEESVDNKIFCTTPLPISSEEPQNGGTKKEPAKQITQYGCSLRFAGSVLSLTVGCLLMKVILYD